MELKSSINYQTVPFQQLAVNPSLRINEEYFDFYNLVLPNFYKEFSKLNLPH